MRFHGKRVSRQWHRVLVEAEKHVRFTLDSGQRTMAEQLRLVREKGVWSPSNPHGAARPFPWAPHIKWGRPNHAIDINSLDGGEQRLQNYLAKHGVHAVNNVPTESWHLDPVNARELRSFYIRLRKQDKRRGRR